MAIIGPEWTPIEIAFEIGYRVGKEDITATGLTPVHCELIRRVHTFEQIGHALGQICRFAGRGKFYPVLAHSFVVAALLDGQRADLKLYGLLHDATEMLVGDIPYMCKVPDQAWLELRMRDEMFKRLHVPLGTAAIWAEVKQADRMALSAEWGIVGPAEGDPLMALPNPTPLSRSLTRSFANMPIDYWLGGRAAIDFERECDMALRGT